MSERSQRHLTVSAPATKVGVVVFPGTNCEADVVEAVTSLGGGAELVWHGAERLPADVGAVILPGGFAHGDYLRTGAIARFSPVMAAVTDFAARGGPVLGICNGFQVLCEAGLLPGALQKNEGLKFLCATVEVVVEAATTSATSLARRGDVLRLPINHFEGNFTCSEQTLSELINNDQIVFSYRRNPNGSMGDVAGICNRARNVVGLMPHPERACHELLGSTDGRVLLASLLATVERGEEAAALTTSSG
jgi:phosphoribosylformylglycinamidine synthase subunit PurQ / glutaminase